MTGSAAELAIMMRIVQSRSMVGRNEKKIAEYIQNQLQEDQAAEQLTIKEYIDAFGEEGKK